MTAPEPRVPVIDMWAPFVPSAEVIDDLREGFPVELLSYFEVFTKTTISAEQFGAYAESLRRTDDQILDSLDDAGITRSLITGFDERSTCGVTFVHNASVAAVAAAIRSVPTLRRCRHPGRRLGSRRVRALGGRARFPRVELASVHDWTARIRPRLLPLLRQMRRAWCARFHPHLRRLDSDTAQRSRPSPPHRRRCLPLP